MASIFPKIPKYENWNPVFKTKLCTSVFIMLVFLFFILFDTLNSKNGEHDYEMSVINERVVISLQYMANYSLE